MNREVNIIRRLIKIIIEFNSLNRIVIILFPIISTLNFYFSVNLVGDFIDYLVAEDSLYLFLIEIFLFSITVLVQALIEYLIEIEGVELRYSIYRKVANKALSIPLEKFESSDVYNKLYFILRPITSIDGYQVIFSYLLSFLSFMMTIVYIVISLFSVGILPAIVSIIWIVMTIRKSMKDSSAFDIISKENASVFTENEYIFSLYSDFSFIKEYKLNSLGQWIMKKQDDINYRYNLYYEKIEAIKLRQRLFNVLGSSLLSIVTVMYLLLMNNKGGLLISNVISIMIMCSRVDALIDNSGILLQEIIKQLPNFKANIEFTEGMEETRNIEIRKGVNEINKLNIELKNVSFGYEKSSLILKNINFKINHGEKVAILGVNGAGKSTLINLILGLYTPTSGTILLNDLDISKYDRSEYLSLFSPMLQDYTIYPFSTKENIVFDKEIENSKILSTLDSYGLSKKINDVNSLGLVPTNIIGVGENFSGGEEQRLVITRTLIDPSKILILDEPSSSLDIRAEVNLFASLEEEYKYETVIFITHRLITTRHCDKIIVLDNGMIKEYGTHYDLLDKQGLYFDMYYAQNKEGKTNE